MMYYYFCLVLILFFYMAIGFIVSIFLKRNDIADVMWGFGFVLLSWSAFLISQTFSWVALIVNILVTIWGLRLSTHIFLRNIKKPEDYRYKKWRDEWSCFYLRSFLQVFMLQGFFLFLIALPILILNRSNAHYIGFISFIGFVVWGVGFAFEVVADYQLSKFLLDSKNKGKILRSGLWKYSRHPNYFGEVMLWWGIFLICFGLTYNILILVSPVIITFLILKVSGIPMLEKKLEENSDFENYKKCTSKFFPMLPKC